MKNLLVIISLVMLVSCGETPSPQDPVLKTTVSSVSLDPEQIKNANIETGQANMQDVASSLRLQGSIEVPPQNMVSVSFPMGGYLKSCKLMPGMQVKKGDILAIMEDAQFITLQQDYLITSSKLELATAEYQRQQGLNAGKASSDKVFQQAKSDYETQRITQRALAEKLRLIGIDPAQLSEDKISRSVSLRSPISGFVSKISVNNGKYTAPTDVLFELLNTEDVHLTLTVFEKDVAKLVVGQKVMAFTSDQPEKKYPAEIILVDKDLDENRSAEVHCHFKQYDKSLLPGMFMNAEVFAKSENSWLVPEEAVVRWQNQHFVFVETSAGVFDMQEVAIGEAQDGKQQIFPKTDLANKKLALKNAYSLLMKMKNNADE